MALTDKQEMFCLEYIKDFNATKAAARSGYSESTAYSIGSENLSKPEIQTRIAELMEQRRTDVKVDANYVLKRLIEIDTLDVADIVNEKGDIKPISQWSKAWRTSVNAIDVSVLNTGDIEAFLKKVKMPDKLKNLELLGKHIDVQAFKEKVENNVISPFMDIMKAASVGYEGESNE
ncbi:terminase small subunit [Dysgonomonas sp. Marseille-P4677]|uniref:terminase small subunit n=1 Tax=Dysgonomonas sp. Marseille-P4677 TaxID=2364790 RepID=UPI001913AE2C|nr:terminase small subunit [Dysgonomonas sp. Marseille-P4677]MBK5722583.1 terminase small subunit [Dysgonomonas sp. Marseille-P4677]